MRVLQRMLVTLGAAALLFTLGTPVGADDKEKTDAPAKRSGDSGKAKGGASGDGGAGGAGGVIQVRELSEKEMAALEVGLTPDEKELFNEYLDLMVKHWADVARKNGRKGGLIPDEALVRKMTFSNLELQKKDLKAFCKELPDQIVDLRKRLDPLYISPEERQAAERLPAGFAAEMDKLLSDDLDIFFAARRKVLLQGKAASAPLAELSRKVEAKDDPILRMRLASIRKDLEAEQGFQKQARVVEAAFRTAAELRKKAPEKKIALLVSRMVTMSGLGGSHDYGYAGTCYFSFPNNENSYGGATSLMFDNGGSGLGLNILMYGGQNNRIQDLGPVDFASLKKAPPPGAESWTKVEREADAVAGHVYLEHCLEARGVDMCVKFKVLAVKQREYVILEWEPIPQEK